MVRSFFMHKVLALVLFASAVGVQSMIDPNPEKVHAKPVIFVK
jgi:hypothetical protein